MEELNIEQLKAVFFDEDALLVQPEPVYRLSNNSERYYYTFNAEGEPSFFVSVTTLIQRTLATSPHLLKWYADNGYEQAKAIAQERAAYGTFMHVEFAELLVNGSYNLENVKERLKAYLETENLSSKLIIWEDDLKKDILAFAQWMIDYDVKPLAVELVLTNPHKGYAGAIDLVCELTVPMKDFWGEKTQKGEPKQTTKDVRMRAIVDFKSGKKGFYESSEIQLKAYNDMWDIHFEQHPIDKIFNWSPKDWRKSPIYNFKDQTGSKNLQKFDYLIELSAIEDEKRSNDVMILSGNIDIKNGLKNNITIMSLSDIVKKAKDQEPEKDKFINELDQIIDAKN